MKQTSRAKSALILGAALALLFGACAPPREAKAPAAAGPETAPVRPESVSLAALKIEPGYPPPVISPEWGLYSVRVLSSQPSVTVTVTPQNEKAGLLINGRAAKAGEPFGPIPVATGLNVIPVEVASADGTAKKSYKLRVTRNHPTPTWVRVSDSAPWAPRDSAGELVFNNRMWIFGGYTPEVIGDIWSSADGKEWVQSGSMPDGALINIPLEFVFQGKMWLVTSDGVLRSSADGAHWTTVTDSVPWKARHAAGAAVFKDRMWILGGARTPSALNDVWSSADGVNWTLETPAAPWPARQVFSMIAVHRDRLWIMGGGIQNYHPFKTYRDVWSTADGKSWTKATDEAPWQGRIWSSAAAYKNRLWVFGGFQAEPNWTNLNDLWYSADGADWRQLPTETVWSPRHEYSVYVFAGKLWVVAGNAWPLVNDAWVLEIKGLSFLTQPVVEDFAGTEYVYRARADFNASGKPVRYRLLEAPDWLAVDAASGVVRGTPAASGEFRVALEAFDDAGETARQDYTLSILEIGS